MGGDGMISLPQMRALHRLYPDLCVLHLDAHTDAYPNDGPGERHRYNPGTTFTCAADEGLVDTGHSLHVGARGPTYEKRAIDSAIQRQYGVISGIELRSRGILDVLREIRGRMAGRSTYLCFDMDFFDPSCAPGVCTPAWGGVSAGEGLALIAALEGLRFVAFDINTVSPPHDVGGMTAFLAASCLHQFLILLCKPAATDGALTARRMTEIGAPGSDGWIAARGCVSLLKLRAGAVDWALHDSQI